MLSSTVFALVACGCFSLSAMLVAAVKGDVDPLRMARWQFTTAAIATGAVSMALSGWRSLEPWHLGLLAVSSFAGIIVASVAYFVAVAKAGPRITALLFSLIAPFSLAFGYVGLGETIAPKQGFGVALVLVGVACAIGVPSLPRGRSCEESKAREIPWLGIAFGIVTALGQAVSSLFARPVMATGLDPFTAMAFRSGLASVLLFGLAALPVQVSRRPYAFSTRDFGLAIAAALVGLALGTTLLMAALQEGNVGIVATLAGMTPVMILPLIWFQTGQPPSSGAWLGAALAVSGTAVISL
jgi:drug/metabolite transporter (DMT)-like permease